MLGVCAVTVETIHRLIGNKEKTIPIFKKRKERFLCFDFVLFLSSLEAHT